MIKRRVVECEIRGIDETSRSAEFVVSTERAVPMGDEREVLRVSGAKLERYRKNPVLLDAHDRASLSSVIGRTEVRVEGRKLVARTFYAPTVRGEEAWQLVKGGFVRATSIGYQINPDKVRKLRKGEIDGDGESRVDGPASVVNEWELLEVSNVPIPADEDAVRRSYQGARNHVATKINYAKLVAQIAARDGLIAADGNDGVGGNAGHGTISGDDTSQTETPGGKVTEKGAEITCPHCGKGFPMPERDSVPTQPFGGAEADGDIKPGRPGALVGASGAAVVMKGAQVPNQRPLPSEVEARVLEANRRSALAITPRGLEDVTERALAEGRSLRQIRQLLVAAQAGRFAPVGTTEPAPLDDDSAQRRSGDLPPEITDDVLIRSFGSNLD